MTQSVQAPDAYPDLSAFAKPEDVQRKPGKKFQPEFISWAVVMRDIREHAPGWRPTFVPGADGGMAHIAPNGSWYVLVQFVHGNGQTTPPVPQACMDDYLGSLPGEATGGRELSDAYMRGICKAAAVHFGYGWQLWSKDDRIGSAGSGASKSGASEAFVDFRKWVDERFTHRPDIWGSSSRSTWEHIHQSAKRAGLNSNDETKPRAHYEMLAAFVNELERATTEAAEKVKTGVV